MSSKAKDTGTRMRLQVTVTSVTKILVAVALLLVLVSLAGQLAVRAFDWHPERDIVSMTNIDRERNIPTTFQTLLMFGCALALAGITLLKRLERDRWTCHWGGLSLIFLLLAWDEIAEIHERFIEPMRRVFDLQGFLFFGWIIPAGIGVVLCGLAYARFVFALPSRTRTLFVVAGTLCLTGALVFEAIGGRYYESIDQNADMTYVLISTIEETLEKAGVIVFLHAALTYLSAALVGARLTLTGEPGRLWLDTQRLDTRPAKREAVRTSRLRK